VRTWRRQVDAPARWTQQSRQSRRAGDRTVTADRSLVMSASDDRKAECEMISEQFLTALELLVRRYRALRTGAENADLFAEAVTGEVAHQLAIARSALYRRPTPSSGRRPESR
jgi:hypothetical protein